MEEEALNDSYGLFKKTGYEGDINKFKTLISTNKEALSDAHGLFVKTGYKGDINKFSELLGLKKKTILNLLIKKISWNWLQNQREKILYWVQNLKRKFRNRVL